MQYSAELRWFFPDVVPARVADWFSLDLAIREEPRVDEYLVIPRCSTVGVKFRNGRLEVKAECEAPRPAEYPTGVSGLSDLWVKWSRAASVPELRRLLDAAEDDWAFVRKDRVLRKFSLDDDEAREVSAPARPNEGCGVELTSVKVKVGKQANLPLPEEWWSDAADWWSLSFESFQHPSHVQRNLETVATSFFASHGPPPIDLTRDKSMSYPVWLAGLPGTNAECRERATTVRRRER